MWDAFNSRFAEARKIGQVLICCVKLEVKFVNLWCRDVRIVIAWADAGEKGSLV